MRSNVATLEQVVKANQLEKDLQSISRGKFPSRKFVRQVTADGFVRSKLVDGADGTVLTVTLVKLNSEIVWQGHARESRAGWLLHEIQVRDATKLASEAAAYIGNPKGAPETSHNCASPDLVQDDICIGFDMAVKLTEEADSFYRNKEFIKTFNLYQNAAREGSANATFMVGYMYQTAEGIGRDVKKAFENYTRAASVDEPHS